MKRRQQVDVNLARIDDQTRKEYEIRLRASIDVARLLLRRGLPFSSSDESAHDSEESEREGPFLDAVKLLADHNAVARPIVLKHDEYHNCVSHEIQKDIVSAFSYFVTKCIIDELVKENEPFALLVGELPVKEHIMIFVRYVDKKGCIIERFLGVIHVSSNAASSLKIAIDAFLANNGLSLSSLRGQSYDSESSMTWEFNGLKTLILNDDKSAYNAYCFAHELQLVLIEAVKNDGCIGSFFESLSMLANTVGASCSLKDLLHVKQAKKVIELIAGGAIETGTSLNQDSHYGTGTIPSVIKLFPSVLDVLTCIEESGNCYTRQQAVNLLRQMENFEYVFVLVLMKSVLGITNELSHQLQRNDKDIVKAMELVRISKRQLNEMRNNDGSFENLVDEASVLCKECEIPIPENMEDNFGVARRGALPISNVHRFKVQLMYKVLDYILEVLNNRFDERTMRLLECMACLDPRNSFAAYDKKKIVELATFYPSDFSEYNIWMLEDQLDSYYADVTTHVKFSNLSGISELAQMLVATRKDYYYRSVYLLLKFAIILPVATPKVERFFSTMNRVKSDVCNKTGDVWIGDEWSNDRLKSYVESELFDTISSEDIIQRFQAMKRRKINVTV